MLDLSSLDSYVEDFIIHKVLHKSFRSQTTLFFITHKSLMEEAYAQVDCQIPNQYEVFTFHIH